MLYAVEALGKPHAELEHSSGSGPVLTVLSRLLQADVPATFAGTLSASLQRTLVTLIHMGCVAHLFEPGAPGSYKLVGYRVTRRGRLLFDTSTMTSGRPPHRGA